MKKIFFAVILLSSYTSLQAQSYLPLPDSNVAWIADIDDGGPGPDYFWRYITDSSYSDTVINSNIYIKLYGAPAPNTAPDGYLGGYRSDTSGKTFYIPRDSTQEFLLMDLAANAGDTIHNVLYGQGSTLYTLQYCVVDSTNFINDGTYLLKRLYVRFPPAFPQNTWIEKIGSTGGFFNHTEPLNYTYLQCMSFNDTTYYFASSTAIYNPIYNYGACQLPTGINDYKSKAIEILVYPNPFSDVITISVSDGLWNLDIEIYDSFSRRIFLKNNLSGLSFSVSMKVLPRGVYYLMIKKDGIETGRKIIKL